MDTRDIGIVILILSVLFLVVVIYMGEVSEEHKAFDNTVINNKIGFQSYIKCPHCGADKDYLSSVGISPKPDNKNVRVFTFFFCKNCSTEFSSRIEYPVQ